MIQSMFLAQSGITSTKKGLIHYELINVLYQWTNYSKVTYKNHFVPWLQLDSVTPWLPYSIETNGVLIHQQGLLIHLKTVNKNK